MTTSKTYLQRFFDKVEFTDTCWIWKGKPDKDGYGRFRLNGKKRGAHCISWEVRHGPIPDGFMPCHNCPGGDRRACVNWDHLWLGTTQDNIADAVLKGRMAKGKRNGKYTHPERTPRGEVHGKCRYSEDVVLKVDEALRAGFSSREVSEQFGLPKATVSMIKGGYTWSWLTRRSRVGRK